MGDPIWSREPPFFQSLMQKRRPKETSSPQLPKAATGIQGLDELTGGGLPRGRPTLICGGPGCGKTLMAAEFLVRGALEQGEPGVFMSFEENAEDLAQNVRSLGFDMEKLIEDQKLVVDHVRVEKSEIQETGEYDLQGLFIRLELAIDSIGARRVVLDTMENLFGGLDNLAILRAELRRLFGWLKDKGMTAVITGERGEGQLTRQGLEEYVSDCVILLDQRVEDQLATRRLRIVKYRGSTHGTNEYPFLIDESGISVLPVTSVGLTHSASSERISTGVSGLDGMLGGEGYYRGSTVLVSGGAGTGKSSLAAHFVDSACRRGERCLYFSFEESEAQIVRNMRSIGFELDRWVSKGLLRFSNSRPTLQGVESHLVLTHKLVEDLSPSVLVIDPLSAYMSAGSESAAQSMLLRLIDFLKMRGITAFFTSLTASAVEKSEVEVSSLIDTWLLIRDIETSGERNRTLYVLKSRGMAHSNQIREFLLTDQGVDLVQPYTGPEGVLTGSLRIAREAQEEASRLSRKQEGDRKQRDVERKRLELRMKMDLLQGEMESLEEEARIVQSEEDARENELIANREGMARRRGSNGSGDPVPRRGSKREKERR